MRITVGASILLLAASSMAQSKNMTLLSKIPNSPCTTGDVWAIGNYMLLARRSQGFAVIDARDPRRPVRKNFLPPGYPRNVRSYGVGDIKSDGRYIYCSDEATGAGVFIYDGKDPMNPVLVGRTGGGNVHNFWVDAPRNLLVTNRGLIYDITSKTSPRQIISLNVGFSHDVIVVDGIAYFSLWNRGIGIWDIKNPRAPRMLGTKDYSGAYTHNMWPSEDRRVLYTTDETNGGQIRIWDISNPQNMRQVGSWRTGPSNDTVHNVHVWGKLAYVTYYKAGIRILSLADPLRPVEIAYYDTYAPTGSGCFGSIYAGCWGVYPWTQDKLFVSDLDSGGYIFQLDIVPGTLTAKSTTVPPGGTIDLDFSYRNDAGTKLDGFGVLWLSTVQQAPVFLPLVTDVRTFSVAQRLTRNVKIPIPVGFPRNITIGFEGYTGTVEPLQIHHIRSQAITIR